MYFFVIYELIIKQKVSFKNYILIIFVDFNVRLSKKKLLPGSGSTFPEVYPDQAK